MPIQFRTYRNDERFGADYNSLRDFLIELDSHNYPFGRWDWMITHSYLDESGLTKIGLWEENGKLVAAAMYDTGLGGAYLLALPGYEGLRAEMLRYARGALSKDGKFRVLIRDGDLAFQDIAASQGFFPVQDTECEAVYPIDDWREIRYTLPEGFSITSMKERFDLFKYGQVLWKGFDHELSGEGPFVFKEEELPEWEREFLRPNVDLSLKIAVVAPNGDFVSYCGMWWDAKSETALVEPVATDPDYRKMGLGRAAVLEGVRRSGALGAKRAMVGSNQQFYYSIGFRPYATSTWWA